MQQLTSNRILAWQPGWRSTPASVSGSCMLDLHDDVLRDDEFLRDSHSLDSDISDANSDSTLNALIWFVRQNRVENTASR